MKSLKPSARENKRYLLVEGKNLKQNVKKAILDFVGVLGMSKTGLSWIKSDSNSAIICINREMVVGFLFRGSGQSGITTFY